MAAIEETPCGSRHGGDCCISSRQDDHDRFSRRHGGSHTCQKNRRHGGSHTCQKTRRHGGDREKTLWEPPWRRLRNHPVGAAMAAIAASVQGATITIASVAAMAAPTPAIKNSPPWRLPHLPKKSPPWRLPHLPRRTRRHGGSHTCQKKLAAMAAIEETPCGSRHGGD